MGPEDGGGGWDRAAVARARTGRTAERRALVPHTCEATG